MHTTQGSLTANQHTLSFNLGLIVPSTYSTGGDHRDLAATAALINGNIESTLKCRDVSYRDLFPIKLHNRTLPSCS